MRETKSQTFSNWVKMDPELKLLHENFNADEEVIFNFI